MSIKNEINQLQKQMLDRLNVRTGSTLYIIIQEISRQAYVKQSFVVSQKNSTLATKCNVTPSTISRNLKKIKEKCSDLLTIEQNRHSDEKFAALVFTFHSEGIVEMREKNSHVQETSNGMTNGMTNGQEHQLVNTDNECIEVAENTSILSIQTNKTLNTKTVNKQVDKENIIKNLYFEFSSKGINKNLFQQVLKEMEKNKRIVNFGAYLRGALEKVLHHISYRNGTKIFANESQQIFYEWLKA